jgi:anoctamin-10
VSVLSSALIHSILDRAHAIPPRGHQTVASPATRLRLLYALLTAPALQQGLGITPREGKWKRVKSIMALHDEENDKAWVDKWAKGDWKVGLVQGMEEGGGLGSHVSGCASTSTLLSL